MINHCFSKIPNLIELIKSNTKQVKHFKVLCLAQCVVWKIYDILNLSTPTISVNF